MSDNSPQSGSNAGAMTKDDASRFQSAGDRNPDSATAQSGFDERAQSAADKAENAKGDK